VRTDKVEREKDERKQGIIYPVFSGSEMNRVYHLFVCQAFFTFNAQGFSSLLTIVSNIRLSSGAGYVYQVFPELWWLERLYLPSYSDFQDIYHYNGDQPR